MVAYWLSVFAPFVLFPPYSPFVFIVPKGAIPPTLRIKNRQFSPLNRAVVLKLGSARQFFGDPEAPSKTINTTLLKKKILLDENILLETGWMRFAK